MRMKRKMNAKNLIPFKRTAKTTNSVVCLSPLLTPMLVMRPFG